LQHLQQFRDRGDLVGLLIRLDLGEYRVILMNVGVDPVNGGLATGGVKTAAKRFAVNGNVLAFRRTGQGMEP
jgi:hypothetical protein